MRDTLCLQCCSRCCGTDHIDDACPFDGQELEQLSSIAAFIAARLNYVLPPCNSGQFGGLPVSTIRVDQHKEKFWGARVYCELAHPDLVREMFQDARARHTSRYSFALSPEQFKATCFRHDAQHYRTCYLDMARIASPKLRSRILSCADYPELLCDGVAELRSWLERHAAVGSLSTLSGRYGSSPAVDWLLEKIAPLYG